MRRNVENFAEGMRKGLGILVRCGCGKSATFRAADFSGIFGPGEKIQDRVWRCSWCGETARSVGYTTIDRNDREGLAQWRPPSTPAT